MINENPGRKIVTIYIINQTLHWFTIGLIIPVVTMFRLEKGLDLFQVGVLSAIMSGTVLLLEIPTGGLADSIGRKKTYIISLCFLFLADVLLYFSVNFTMLIGGSLLFGTARAVSSGTMDAWFVDEFYRVEEKNKLQPALAKVHAFVPAGLAVSALLAGWLPQSLGALIRGSTGNTVYAANLAVQALFVCIQIGLTALLIGETRVPSGSGGFAGGFRQVPKIIKESIRVGFRNRDILFIFIAVFGWGVGFAGLENFWQPRFESVAGENFRPFLLGIMTFGYFLSGSVGSLLSTPASRLFRKNLPLLLFVSRIVKSGLFLALAYMNGIAGFAVLYFILFSLNGLANSPQDSIFNERIDEKQRSTLLSFQSFFMQTGGMLGILIIGYLARSYSIPLSWIVSASVLGVTGVFFIFIRRT